MTQPESSENEDARLPGEIESKRLETETWVFRTDQGHHVVILDGNPALIKGAESGTAAIEEAQKMFPYDKVCVPVDEGAA